MTKEEEYRLTERLAEAVGMELVEIPVSGRSGRSRTEFKLLPGKEPRQIPKWLAGSRFSWEELDLRLSAMGF